MNEAGIKRYRSLLKNATKLGIEVMFTPAEGPGNGMIEAELEKFIG